jgi:uncharacterized membrane-anchored protein
MKQKKEKGGITMINVTEREYADKRIVQLLDEIEYLNNLRIIGPFPKISKAIANEIKVREKEIVQLEKEMGIHHED